MKGVAYKKSFRTKIGGGLGQGIIQHNLGPPNYWYINGHFCCFYCLLTVFDHQCTNRHRSTKTVPTVYQQSNTVKRLKTAKMTIGVPIVTCLHRVRRRHKVRVRVRRPRPPSASAEYTKPLQNVRDDYPRPLVQFRP